MKFISQRLKYVVAAPLFLVASLVLSFSSVEFASATALTWDGSSGDGKFSTGANWSTGSAPIDGDSIVLPATILSSNTTIDNDILSLSLAGISVTGSSDDDKYTITGNAITLTADVSIQTSTTFSAQLITSGTRTFNVATADSTLQLNGGVDLTSGNIIFTGGGSATCGYVKVGALSGSGSLTSSTAGIVSLDGSDNSAYTGAINITSGIVYAQNANALGATSAPTTVSSTGTLTLTAFTDVTYAEPLVLSGSGKLVTSNALGGLGPCSGGAAGTGSITQTGSVTLNSDFVFNGVYDLTITGAYVPNGHTFSVQSGANGTLVTPDGTLTAPEITTDLSGDSPTTDVSVVNKETATLSGTRQSISVFSGGILKGTGTVQTLYVTGKVAPGNSPGTLTVLETFSLSGEYEAEVLNTSSYDQLRVGETYTGGGNAVILNTGAILTVVLYDGWSVTQGNQFTIIDNRHSSAVSGTFNGLAEGAQFVVSNEGVDITFSITYVGGDGNDVVITALNTGTDPTPPNTGVAKLILANPAIVAVLGLTTTGLLALVIFRRRATK